MVLYTSLLAQGLTKPSLQESPFISTDGLTFYHGGPPVPCVLSLNHVVNNAGIHNLTYKHPTWNLAYHPSAVTSSR